MRKEKERATTTSSLSSFENHVSIEFRTKWLIKVLQLRAEIFAEHFFKQINSVISYLNCLLHSKDVFSLVEFNFKSYLLTYSIIPCMNDLLIIFTWHIHLHFNITLILHEGNWNLWIVGICIRPTVKIFYFDLVHGQSLTTI
jgi:hypothetical protein